MLQRFIAYINELSTKMRRRDPINENNVRHPAAISIV